MEREIYGDKNEVIRQACGRQPWGWGDDEYIFLSFRRYVHCSLFFVPSTQYLYQPHAQMYLYKYTTVRL